MEHLVALYGPAPCGTLRTPVGPVLSVLSVLMASDGSIQAPGTGGNAVNSWDLSDGPLSPLVGKHGHNLAQFSMGKIWKNRTSLSRFSTFSEHLRYLSLLVGKKMKQSPGIPRYLQVSPGVMSPHLKWGSLPTRSWAKPHKRKHWSQPRGWGWMSQRDVGVFCENMWPLCKTTLEWESRTGHF